ncbi:hypothetical protein [Pectobacterium phage PcaP2EGY]
MTARGSLKVSACLGYLWVVGYALSWAFTNL